MNCGLPKTPSVSQKATWKRGKWMSAEIIVCIFWPNASYVLPKMKSLREMRYIACDATLLDHLVPRAHLSPVPSNWRGRCHQNWPALPMDYSKRRQSLANPCPSTHIERFDRKLSQASQVLWRNSFLIRIHRLCAFKWQRTRRFDWIFITLIIYSRQRQVKVQRFWGIFFWKCEVCDSFISYASHSVH